MKKITLENVGEFQLRGGGEFGLYATDHECSRPIVGWYIDSKGRKCAATWHSDGTYVYGYTSIKDIIPKYETVKIDAWFNAYRNGHISSSHAAESDAVYFTVDGVVARFHIKQTLMVGDGLTDKERERLGL